MTRKLRMSALAALAASLGLSAYGPGFSTQHLQQFTEAAVPPQVLVAESPHQNSNSVESLSQETEQAYRGSGRMDGQGSEGERQAYRGSGRLDNDKA